MDGRNITMFKTKSVVLEFGKEIPGKIGPVSAYTGSVDLPNTSVTMHSHFRHRPTSSSRIL